MRPDLEPSYCERIPEEVSQTYRSGKLLKAVAKSGWSANHALLGVTAPLILTAYVEVELTGLSRLLAEIVRSSKRSVIANVSAAAPTELFGLARRRDQ